MIKELENLLQHSVLDMNYEKNLKLLYSLECFLNLKYIRTETFQKYSRNILNFDKTQRDIFLTSYHFFLEEIKNSIYQEEFSRNL